MSDDPLREMARGWCDDEGCLEGWRVDSLTALLHRAVADEMTRYGWDAHVAADEVPNRIKERLNNLIDHHTRLGKEE